MVGTGIYVLTGTVARDMAGPGVILSFLIAGFASFLSALCYAEMASLIPKAGSAYVYTYVSVNEVCAFFVGWSLILEHMIGMNLFLGKNLKNLPVTSEKRARKSNYTTVKKIIYKTKVIKIMEKVQNKNASI